MRSARPLNRKNLWIPSEFQRGFLAEPYDGLAQFAMITTSRSSSAAAIRAMVGVGDFGTPIVGTFPEGTPITFFSNHGQLSIITLGNTSHSNTQTASAAAKARLSTKIIPMAITPGAVGIPLVQSTGPSFQSDTFQSDTFQN